MKEKTTKIPSWMRTRFNPESTEKVSKLMEQLSLNTVCKESNCPNLGECYKNRTATFMILGKHCTRNCQFCNITTKKPEPVDENEPENLAKAVEDLGLKHVVITSVDRDDLPDEGAGHFQKTIRAVRKRNPDVTIEVLIPDFHAREELLDLVINEKPDIINHNLETVRRLMKTLCPQCNYDTSIRVLEYVREKDPNILTKTGIMVGLGETEEEVYQLMDDCLDVGCHIMTIGQYMPPSKDHYKLEEYVRPEQFKKYGKIGMEKGFGYVESNPLVRSSYKAAEALKLKDN